MGVTSLATVLLGVSAHAEPQMFHGYVSSKAWLARDEVVAERIGTDLLATSLPANWDWRNVGGVSYVTTDVNQHIPKYCGSCWIHGTVATLNDRIKIMRKAAYPEVMLSRQALINCVPGENTSAPNPGCSGGDAFQIHKYMYSNPIPDETCMPYQAENQACTPFNVCMNCAPPANPALPMPGMPTGCFAIQRQGWSGYSVSEYGQVKGEAAMMREIKQRGPIACTMACDGNFVANYSNIAVMHEGVYMIDHYPNETDHVVEVTGWGETASGIKYWVARNSWGTYWGHNGWFKIRRGVNQNLIEHECDWAVPKFDELDKSLEGFVMGDYDIGLHAVEIPQASESNAAAVAVSQPTAISTFALIMASAASAAAVLLFVGWARRHSARQLRQPTLLG